MVTITRPGNSIENSVSAAESIVPKNARVTEIHTEQVGMNLYHTHITYISESDGDPDHRSIQRSNPTGYSPGILSTDYASRRV